MVTHKTNGRDWRKEIPANLTFQAKLLRRFIRRINTQFHYRYWNLQDVPILFANSFPKSGTHLLIQVLQGLTKIGPAVDSGLPAIVTYQGDTGVERRLEEILFDLNRLLPADIAFGHLHAQSQIIENLTSEGFTTFFISRDPRDVVVSHVFYISEEVKHVHHHYYTQHLQNMEERLMTSIVGLPQLKNPFPDISQRFAPYLPWLDTNKVLPLRYEDFVERLDITLGHVLAHASKHGFPCLYEKEIAVDRLRASINPGRSPTFRSGKTGEWQKYFTQENKRVFKDVAGELLIHLGYERNYDW